MVDRPFEPIPKQAGAPNEQDVGCANKGPGSGHPEAVGVRDPLAASCEISRHNR